MTAEKKERSPIMSGWRGHINGFIEDTSSHIKVDQIALTLDHKTAWALCNLLADETSPRFSALGEEQKKAISNLGAALGRMIDHPSANNGGRKVIE